MFTDNLGTRKKNERKSPLYDNAARKPKNKGSLSFLLFYMDWGQKDLYLETNLSKEFGYFCLT